MSTRELRRGETEPSLLDVLAAGDAELDLDDPAAQERDARGRARLHRRAAAAWTRGWTREAVAGYLAGEASMTVSGPFLLARLVTDQLRATPVDTSRPGWQQQVSHRSRRRSTGTWRSDGPRPPAWRSRDAAEAARILLAALTWGLGAGLPEEEWLACANAIAPGGRA